MNEEQREILEEIVSDLGALRDRLEELNNNVDDSGLNSAFCLLDASVGDLETIAGM